jgi:hypothetical protein
MATETRIYDLGIHYGLKPENGAKKVKDIYPKAGTERAALPWAWKAATGKLLGLSADDFRELHVFTAALLDASYRQEADGNMASGLLNTFNFVTIPPGRYLTNANVPIPRSGIKGANSFPYYGVGGDQGYATTEIRAAKVYLKSPAERYAIAAPNFWDSLTFAHSSWNESCRVSDLCLTNEEITPDRLTIGYFASMPGEVNAADNIRANGFDIGICIEGATPFTGGDFSVFANRIAGVATRGGALSTASMQTISGDRNGSIFRQLPGRGGQHAGGSFTFNLGKCEDANVQGGGSYGSQVVAWCSGQFVVVVGNCRPTTEDRINDAAFVVYPYISDGSGGKWKQNSLLKATGIGHRYNTLLHDLGTGQRIAWPGDFKAFDFTYASEDNSFFTSLPGDWKWEQAGTAVLGSVERDPMTGRPMGGWDYLSRTPSRGDDRDDGIYGSSPARGVVKRPVDMDALRAEIRAMVDAAIGGAPADDAALRDAATRARDILDGAL